MAFCNLCGAKIADGTTTCAACSGRAAGAPAVAVSGMADNVAGMLAYVTFIPAIVFLVTSTLQPEPIRPFPLLPKHFFLRGHIRNPGGADNVDCSAVPDFYYRAFALTRLFGSAGSLDRPVAQGEPGLDVSAASVIAWRPWQISRPARVAEKSHRLIPGAPRPSAERTVPPATRPSGATSLIAAAAAQVAPDFSPL